jgi:hypothetical protein
MGHPHPPTPDLQQRADGKNLLLRERNLKSGSSYDWQVTTKVMQIHLGSTV